MNEERFKMMLRSSPWSETGYNVPVAVRISYTVMGRIGDLWETILPATDDIHIARRTMDAANASRRFNRIVITQGNNITRQSSAWTTIECALPVTDQLGTPLYTTLMRDMQRKAANNNITKESQNFLLGIACLFGVLLQSPQALAFVACLAVIDCLYLADKTALPGRRILRLNHLRNWAYSTLNGGLLLCLLFIYMPF